NLRDSLRLANISNGVKKTIVAEFDQAKNIVELDSFKRDDRIKSLLLTASLITIFLSLIILLVFAFNRLQNKKHIAKLEVLNTALNTTNEKLEISLNSLEGSYADNDRLIKAVAHDMRSPMVAVVGVLDLLCSEEMDEESRANLLKLAKESSQKGLGVLDDVLKSKVNNELPKSLVDLKSIIESSVSVVNQSAIDKKQSIILDVADVAVNVNEGKIWRVLNNLLTNAIKFSFRGGKIEVSTQVDTDNVTISVKDFGIGIPENIRGNLFDFFTKASRKGTNGEETHGLGLAITKQIVEAHKGKIWVESEPNIGTTFYVQLPI
ncbi:MAG: HAMP domain-containing histidine kinase, partial [Bacteroidia bacterium]|nr:HAMP domain-containing histidine kinase [Bacteroidia bacterium]